MLCGVEDGIFDGVGARHWPGLAMDKVDRDKGDRTETVSPHSIFVLNLMRISSKLLAVSVMVQWLSSLNIFRGWCCVFGRVPT